MKLKLLIVPSIIIIICSQVFAKDTKLKFGNINQDDLLLKVYSADTSAHALVLNEKGNAYFSLRGSQGSNYKYAVLKRIKIFTKDGLDNANISIPLYHSGTAKETITGIKGFTYNLIDDKLEKTKLEKSSIHRESTTDYYETIKITFPNVKPGSIIEIKYSITSNLFGSLRGWNFQYDIPVRESEYTVDIPEYFKYKTHLKGYESLTTSTVTEISRDELNQYRYHWKANNVPAFKTEPFMLAEKGFVSGMEFELSSINVPGVLYEDYSSTWETVKNDLLETDGLGKELSGGGYLKQAVQQIELESTDMESKMEAAFQYVQNHMKWNENYSTYPSSSLKKAYNEKEGNCADINLILTVLLNKLGIKSHPVLVCSRSNGLFNSFIAKRSAFDYMITVATLNGKEILLDATDRICKSGDLPFRSLNSKGLKIAPGPLVWVDFTNIKARKRIVCNINLSDLDNTKGSISYQHLSYSSYLYHKKVEDKTEEEIIEDFEEENDWLYVENFSKKESATNSRNLAVTYDCEITDFVEESGDAIYINPFLVERQKSNPFTLKDRKYPVDFGYAQKEEIIVSIICPEGYEFETIPKTAKISLPNNSGAFTYLVKNHGSTLNIVSNVDIKKSMFTYDEYAFLKEFFNLIVSKHSEMIVLKKRS